MEKDTKLVLTLTQYYGYVTPTGKWRISITDDIPTLYLEVTYNVITTVRDKSFFGKTLCTTTEQVTEFYPENFLTLETIYTNICDH